MEEIKKRRKPVSDKFVSKSSDFVFDTLVLGGKEITFTTQEEAKKIIEEYRAKKKQEQSEKGGN